MPDGPTPGGLAQLLAETVLALSAARRERDSYRLLAQQAIHALHDVSKDRDRLQARYYALLDEYRAARRRAA